jgi:hypothetical protein
MAATMVIAVILVLMKQLYLEHRHRARSTEHTAWSLQQGVTSVWRLQGLSCLTVTSCEADFSLVPLSDPFPSR